MWWPQVLNVFGLERWGVCVCVCVWKKGNKTQESEEAECDNGWGEGAELVAWLEETVGVDCIGDVADLVVCRDIEYVESLAGCCAKFTAAKKQGYLLSG